MFKRLHRFFSSIKLAVVLVLIITVFSVIATFVPQGKSPEYYYQLVSRFAAEVVLATGMDRFFTSILFLLPVGLFFINLSVCTVTRIARQRGAAREKSVSGKMFGPDIIHIGLLVLMVGAVISFTQKREGFVYLAEGETVNLPKEYSVTLKTFEFQKYDDGRPKDWISTVTVTRNNKTVFEAYKIEVNKPLKLNGMKVYQSSFATRDFVALETPSGTQEKLAENHHVTAGSGIYFFVGTGGAERTAVFEYYEDQTLVEVYRFSKGDSFEGYTVTGITAEEVTGLHVKDDPGVVPVFIGLGIVGIGLGLTYYYRLREKQQ